MCVLCLQYQLFQWEVLCVYSLMLCVFCACSTSFSEKFSVLQSVPAVPVVSVRSSLCLQPDVMCVLCLQYQLFQWEVHCVYSLMLCVFWPAQLFQWEVLCVYSLMCVLCLQYQLFQWEVLCVYSLMLCVFCACSTSCFSETFSVSTAWCYVCFVPAVPVVSVRSSLCLQSDVCFVPEYQLQWEVLCVYSLMLCVFCACSTSCFSEKFSVSTAWCYVCFVAVPVVSVRSSLSTAWCYVCFVPAVPVVSVRSSLCLQSDVCFVPAVPVVSVRSSLCLQPDVMCACSTSEKFSVSTVWCVFCACSTSCFSEKFCVYSLMLCVFCACSTAVKFSVSTAWCYVCFVPAVPVVSVRSSLCLQPCAWVPVVSVRSSLCLQSDSTLKFSVSTVMLCVFCACSTSCFSSLCLQPCACSTSCFSEKFSVSTVWCVFCAWQLSVRSFCVYSLMLCVFCACSTSCFSEKFSVSTAWCYVCFVPAVSCFSEKFSVSTVWCVFCACSTSCFSEKFSVSTAMLCVFCACSTSCFSEKFSVSTAWCYVCFVPAVPVVSVRSSLCLQSDVCFVPAVPVVSVRSSLCLQPDVMCVLCLQYQLFQWEVLCVYSLMLCVFCACSTSCFSEKFSVSTVWCVFCVQYQLFQWEVLCVYSLMLCVFCACSTSCFSEKFSVSTAWCYVCFVPAVPVVSVRSSLCLQSDVCFVPAVPVVSVRSSLCLQPDVMCVLCLQYQLFQWEVLCVYSVMLCVFCACSTSCFSEKFSVSTVWCVFCACSTSCFSEKFSVSTAWCYVCFVPAVPVVSVRSSLCLQSDISCVCFVFCACTTSILWRVAVRSSLRLQPDVCVVCFVPAVPVSCGELQWEVLFTGWSATTLNQDSPLSCQLPLSPFALCGWPAEVSVMRVISHHTVLCRWQANISWKKKKKIMKNKQNNELKQVSPVMSAYFQNYSSDFNWNWFICVWYVYLQCAPPNLR